MAIETEFLTGVIEGFYGRAWSFETRLAYADYLSAAGLNTCIYCPKGDLYLRSRWQEDWPAADWLALRQLSSAYRQRGLKWGVGLSPVELYRHYGREEREALRRKVGRLGELESPVLAILFDDMPGDLDALATRQAEIVADVCAWLPDVLVLVCPTYYSFDPVLETHFGAMPADYWPQLGRELPADTRIFWTGNKVCSESISEGDIRAIVEQLARPVILWDNYPVNDGAVRSNFLFTTKLAERSPALRPLLSGHLCNPMNQGLLSLPALSGLSELYGSGKLDDATLAGILGPATWEHLSRDRHDFQYQGLSGLGEKRCAALAAEYAGLPGAAAAEVAQWLSGEYRFDPACLTL
ncbi:MAG: beta-N-acetylglucosaminidase domain-containing protein [Halioglobus sp.]|nr:beta-N-acetylglucosaminidase domain-containing protein [Halioglobus sp.]